jgi:hypothetical protein
MSDRGDFIAVNISPVSPSQLHRKQEDVIDEVKNKNH